jgi:purine/pyrimidine-nucleoside phosphorylase
MSEFKNVNVIKKANVYFDGKVSSRTLQFSDGSIKTLGLMLPGKYLFNTEYEELMEIYLGKLDYQLTNSNDWITIKAGESFQVPASSSFKVKVIEITDYCCSFIK